MIPLPLGVLRMCWTQLHHFHNHFHAREQSDDTLLWPITVEAGNPMNQSEVENNQLWRREKASKVLCLFSFSFDWLRKWHDNFLATYIASGDRH